MNQPHCDQIRWATKSAPLTTLSSWSHMGKARSWNRTKLPSSNGRTGQEAGDPLASVLFQVFFQNQMNTWVLNLGGKMQSSHYLPLTAAAAGFDQTNIGIGVSWNLSDGGRIFTFPRPSPARFQAGHGGLGENVGPLFVRTQPLTQAPPRTLPIQSHVFTQECLSCRTLTRRLMVALVP